MVACAISRSIFPSDLKVESRFWARSNSRAHGNLCREIQPGMYVLSARWHTFLMGPTNQQLRDLWAAEITKEGGTGTARIDILSWLSKMTLDVIGLAGVWFPYLWPIRVDPNERFAWLGFSYKFDALSKDNKPNELNDAFATIFKSGSQLSALGALQAWFPIFRIFVSFSIAVIGDASLKFIFKPAERGAEIRQARDTMSRIAKQLLQDSKASLTLASKSSGSSPRTRDLLSLLLRANTSTDIPQSQRLSDGDVLAREWNPQFRGCDTHRISRGSYISSRWA